MYLNPFIIQLMLKPNIYILIIGINIIIEDLKTVNGKIVGEKHIKSILIGKDGSSIKTIAFNAVENDLAAYLLKKNNKTFNIAQIEIKADVLSLSLKYNGEIGFISSVLK